MSAHPTLVIPIDVVLIVFFLIAVLCFPNVVRGLIQRMTRATCGVVFSAGAGLAQVIAELHDPTPGVRFRRARSIIGSWWTRVHTALIVRQTSTPSGLQELIALKQTEDKP